MHTEMWEHPSVQDNLRLLRSRGVHVVEPETGRLAGGDVGAGRLAEPETIVAAVDGLLTAEHEHDLTGLRVVVTAGGTREPIDPVRFIGNRSSGKQGHAVAEEAAEPGRQGHPRHHHVAAGVRRASTSCAWTRPPRWSRPCSAGPTRPTWS